MKRNNIVLLKVFALILLIGVIVFAGWEVYYTQYALSDRMAYIDKLEKEASLKEKYYKAKLDSIAVINENGSLTMDGKEVSVSSIIKSANEWYSEKERLKVELARCMVLQKAYEGCYNQQTGLFNQAVTISQNNAKRADENAAIADANFSKYKNVVKKYSPDKYTEYEFFYKTVKKEFGLDYTIKNSNDSTRELSFKPNSHLDSALAYFKAFKEGKIRTNIIFKDETKRKGKNN